MNKIGLTLSALLLFSCVAMLYAHTEMMCNDKQAEVTMKAHGHQNNGKILVAYFTWPEPDGIDAASGASRVLSDGKLYGNTEYIAHIIREATGGDLFAIKTERTYPTPHKALIDDAKKEAEANGRPKLLNHIKNLSDYDIIFVGYPNWWYDMPMVIYTFFDEYDFKGKTVIPFVTHGGSSFSQSVETIAEMEKDANVIKGPSIPVRSVPDAQASIINWLKQHELINK